MALLGSSWEDPRTQGILGMAAGLLQASGSSPRPIGMGEALGMGLQGMQQGRAQALQQQALQQQQELRQAQAQAMQQQIAQRERVQNILGQAFGLPQGQPGQMPQGQMPQGQGQMPQGQGGQMPQGQGGQMPRGQGGFPLSLNQVMALRAAGGPDFFDQYKYATDGIKREAGQYYTNPLTGETQYMPRIPEGGTLGPSGEVVPLSGAAGVQAQMAGGQTAAQEAARSAFDLVEVYDPQQGGMVRIPRSQALQQTYQTSPPSGDAAYGEVLAKEAGDTYVKMQQAARDSIQQIATLDHLEDLLQDVGGGSLLPLGKRLASMAASIGVDLDPNLSRKEAADSIVGLLALQTRTAATGENLMPGALSDSDVNILFRTQPSMTQTAEGRKLIIDRFRAVARRQQDVAGFARKWQQQFGRIDRPDPTGKSFQDYLQEWSSVNRLFPEVQ